MWDGRPARSERTGGTPIPQTCVNYLICDPKLATKKHSWKIIIKTVNIRRYKFIVKALDIKTRIV